MATARSLHHTPPPDRVALPFELAGTFSSERAAAYLAAQSVPGVGPVRLKRLVDAFGGIEGVLTAAPARIAAVESIPADLAPRLVPTLTRELPAALRRVRAALAAGLEVLTWEDRSYPRPLRDDPDGNAPLLFVEGRLPPQLQSPSDRVRGCAVVGTRQASGAGRGFARDLGRALSREGIVVVSGLALGIDAAAHEGALEAVEDAGLARQGQPSRASLQRYRWPPEPPSAPLFPTEPAVVGGTVAGGTVAGGTVAVLGGGHGHLHPARHAGLARRIVASGGAILSEWPPDAPPRPELFLRRNRVISGLARAVAVVEAGARSGANNTVTHALRQGRPVLAVPFAPWSRAGRGCLELLRQGAGVIVDESDLFLQFAELTPRPAKELEREWAALDADAPPAPSSAISAAAAVPAAPGTPPAAPGTPPAPRPDALVRRLLAATAELSLDALLAQVPLAPGALLALLARLELEGEVARLPNGRYRWRGHG